MSTARKKPTKRPAKPPARKAVSPKPSAAARKKPAKPAARREPAPAAPAPAAPALRPTPAPRPTRARSSAAKAAAKPSGGSDVRGRLGAKWVCFKCSAKFYDLNRPEPLCPKCGANQNERPKREAKPKHVVVEAPPPRPVEPDRDLIPAEEDEEDALLMEDEEIDLGTPELGEGAEEFGEEEEEEPGDV